VHKHGALAGHAFWATPGGGLETGETFAEAAIRELKEETGIAIDSIGDPVARREFVMMMPDGEQVVADEQFFVVPVEEQPALRRDQWTALEVEVMADHRWWTATDLQATRETVWPHDLPAILESTGRWHDPATEPK